jgi:hypothetical protein
MRCQGLEHGLLVTLEARERDLARGPVDPEIGDGGDPGRRLDREVAVLQDLTPLDEMVRT